MTRALIPGFAVSAFVASLAVATPAAAEPAERAVAACRAELLSRFPDGVRNYRVTDISGNSRRTRVTISVSADRRYRFDCAAGADGRILSAAFDPPHGEARQVAAGQR